eukprot:SAG31_NODE_11917_length_986_cov_1.414882_2_plen_161_part_00
MASADSAADGLGRLQLTDAATATGSKSNTNGGAKPRAAHSDYGLPKDHPYTEPRAAHSDYGLPKDHPYTEPCAAHSDYGLPKDHPYTEPSKRLPSAVKLRTAAQYAELGGTQWSAGPDPYRTHPDDPDPLGAQKCRRHLICSLSLLVQLTLGLCSSSFHI